MPCGRVLWRRGLPHFWALPSSSGQARTGQEDVQLEGGWGPVEGDGGEVRGRCGVRGRRGGEGCATNNRLTPVTAPSE